jgi:hypothetical protein
VDKKDKDQVIGGMQRLAAGALGVGVSLATRDPMAGMAASAAAMTATDYMKSKLSGENATLVVAEENVLLDYCAKLDERVRKIEERLVDTGQKPDRQDLLSKEVTFSRFAKGLGEASTVEKREALVHATAYQFDPRKGSPATRDHWLRRVRELPEAELSFVLLLAAHTEVAFSHRQIYWSDGGGGGGPLGLLEEDVVAYEAIAEQMTNAGYGSLVYKTSARLPIESTAVVATAFVLKRDGRILVSFCKDD